jgi:hypothetical protein
MELQNKATRIRLFDFFSPSDACVPHELVCILSVLLRLVRYRATDEVRPRGNVTDEGSDRLVHHRFSCDHSSRETLHWLVL